MSIYTGMNKNNTALLVIDPVNSCAHEKCETPEWHIHFSKIRKMLPKLNKFINDYRRLIGGLVILTTITPWDKEHLPKNLSELYTDPKAYYYSEDTTSFDEKFYAIEPDKTDVIIVKNTYDAFSNPNLVKVLNTHGIKYIVITGVFTDGCVLATTASGFSKGYNFIFLKDMIETTDVEIRQELQKLLFEYTFPIMYGKTIKAKELLKTLA